MNTHYIKKKDGQIIYLDSEVISMVMRDLKERKDIWYHGRLIPRDQIADFGPVNDSSSYLEENRGGLLSSGELLPAVTGTSFWQQIIRINTARKEQGKPFLYNSVILLAIEQSGFDDPETLEVFLDSEWEIFGRENTSKFPERMRIVNFQHKFCGHCENGWLQSKDGMYPCSCNEPGKEHMQKYKEDLTKQGISW